MTSIETNMKPNALPVMLSIRGEQYFDDVDPDGTELMTAGTMELLEDGRILLEYEETALTGMEGTTTSFEVNGPRVTLTRAGKVNSQMVFEEGVTCESLYQLEFGALMITICASHVAFDLTEEGGTIDLTYSIEIEQSEAGVIEYHLDIQSR